jgi:hypothetical protein
MACRGASLRQLIRRSALNNPVLQLHSAWNLNGIDLDDEWAGFVTGGVVAAQHERMRGNLPKRGSRRSNQSSAVTPVTRSSVARHVTSADRSLAGRPVRRLGHPNPVRTHQSRQRRPPAWGRLSPGAQPGRQLRELARSQPAEAASAVLNWLR